MPRLLIVGALLLIAQISSSKCDSSAAGNMIPVVVNGGPTNNAFNQPFVSVTVCVPGSSNCQTIDGILLDTGSDGLRIVSSALRIPLTQQTNATGSVVECLPFLDSVTWGPVVTADVRLGSELANNVPIQIIGTDKFPSIPSACSNQGTPEETTDDLFANGILGIGLGIRDCGVACATTGASNPGLYYSCPGNGACQITAQPVANQVANPVSQFAADNNGFVVRLPSVAIGGQAAVSGALVFGIGTQSNNALEDARVLTTDAIGNIRTTFNTQTYPGFLDSGSNGIFFLDSATTGLPRCRQSIGFYCPPSIVSFSATQSGINRTTVAVSFNAGNVDAINTTFSAMGDATGENPGGFDWGLPFFFGRSVYVAITGRSTPGGTGPYWAF